MTKIVVAAVFGCALLLVIHCQAQDYSSISSDYCDKSIAAKEYSVTTSPAVVTSPIADELPAAVVFASTASPPAVVTSPTADELPAAVVFASTASPPAVITSPTADELPAAVVFASTASLTAIVTSLSAVAPLAVVTRPIVCAKYNGASVTAVEGIPFEQSEHLDEPAFCGHLNKEPNNGQHLASVDARVSINDSRVPAVQSGELALDYKWTAATTSEVTHNFSDWIRLPDGNCLPSKNELIQFAQNREYSWQQLKTKIMNEQNKAQRLTTKRLNVMKV